MSTFSNPLRKVTCLLVRLVTTAPVHAAIIFDLSLVGFEWEGPADPGRAVPTSSVTSCSVIEVDNKLISTAVVGLGSRTGVYVRVGQANRGHRGGQDRVRLIEIWVPKCAAVGGRSEFWSGRDRFHSRSI